MFFNRKSISENYFFRNQNEIIYEISKNENFLTSLKIISNFTAEFTYLDRVYVIKPIVRFFTISRYKILLDNIEIGEIKYSGWNWIKPKIKIKLEENYEDWIFDPNKPSIIKNRKDTYDTFLSFKESVITYNMNRGDYLTKNKHKRGIFGTINDFEINPILGVIGLFLNELLIFDEMDK